MLTLSPLGDRVVISVGEVKKYPGMIIIPDTAQELAHWGTVVGRGPAVKSEDIWVGQKVIFAKYSGQEIELEQEKFLVLREAEVLGYLVHAEEFLGDDLPF